MEIIMSALIVVSGIILTCVCGGLATLFLISFKRERFINALVFKGLASLCFVVFGAISCFINPSSISELLIFLGLCLGLIGDELIALCQVLPKYDMGLFIGGGAFFLVGHIIYATSLLLRGGISWISLALSFIIAAAVSIIYEKRKRFLSPEMKRPLVLYLGIVIFMMATAIGAFVGHISLGTGLFALGGVMFVVSDNILFAYKLGKEARFSQNIILHVTYYIAQLAIAWSISLL